MSEHSSKLPEYDIFISYSHEDAKRVQILAGALEVEGWQVFWDKNIPAGEDWESFIGVNLDTAPVVISVWSSVSVKSRFVRDEVSRANKRRALVPVMIDDVEPMFGFGSIHASNIVEWIASSGDRLPDHLRTSIRRKLASVTPAFPIIDRKEKTDRAEATMTSFTLEREPQISALRTSPAPQTGGGHFAEGVQTRSPAVTSVRKHAIIASTAAFILAATSIGFFFFNREQTSKETGPPVAGTSASPSPIVAPPTPTVASPSPTVAPPTSAAAPPTPAAASPTPTVAPPTPTVAPPTQTVASPTPTVAPPTPTVDTACPTSRDAVLKPILALFDAWTQLNVELYLAQWGPDAVAKGKDYERTFAELATRRRQDFGKYREVNVIHLNPTIVSVGPTTAKVNNNYSMRYVRTNGQAFNEDEKESYLLECVVTNHSWRIRENTDYQ